MDLRRLRWTCYLMVGARALYVVSALNLQKCNIGNRLGLNYIYFLYILGKSASEVSSCQGTRLQSIKCTINVTKMCQRAFCIFMFSCKYIF